MQSGIMAPGSSLCTTAPRCGGWQCPAPAGAQFAALQTTNTRFSVLPCRLGALPTRLCFRRSSRCLPPRRRRQLGCQATAAPELDLPQPAVGTPSPAELEARDERALAAGRGDIYGIPRQEWIKLQSPSRYLGNEFGAVHKPWEQADIRFALTYPEIYEGG